jgi:hypothetical protein
MDFIPNTIRPSCPTRESIEISLVQEGRKVWGHATTLCWDSLLLEGDLWGETDGASLTIKLWSNDQSINTLIGTVASAKLDVWANDGGGYVGGPKGLHLSR